jgi:hypothetical protein
MTTSGAASPILTPQTIKAEGVTTAYLQGGFAEPVLMPHSSGTDVSATANWQYTSPVLAENFHVQAPTSSGSVAPKFQPITSNSLRAWAALVSAFLGGS